MVWWYVNVMRIMLCRIINVYVMVGGSMEFVLPPVQPTLPHGLPKMDRNSVLVTVDSKCRMDSVFVPFTYGIIIVFSAVQPIPS